MKIHRCVLAVLVTLSSAVMAQTALSPEAQLKAAMNRELVDRDLPGAIEQYKHIADAYPANHPVASKALLQLGAIYERLGKADARSTYLRIVKDYPDSGATFAAASARLAAIQEVTGGPFKSKSLDAFFKDAGGISVSPDGKYVAYSREKVPNKDGSPAPDALYLREISNGREQILMDARPGQGIGTFFLWAPDGQRGSLVVSMPGGFELHVIALRNHEDITIGRKTGVATAGVWSPDSRRLAYFTRPIPQGTWDLHAALLDTATLDVGLIGQFEPSPSAPMVAWSPDSQKLAFGNSAASGHTIQIVAVGSNHVTSIPVPKDASTLRTSVRQWTTGGDIAFVQDVTGGNDVFLVAESGGQPSRICEGRAASDGNECTALSHDGNRQVIRENSAVSGRLIFRSLGDGSEHSLTPEAVFEAPALGRGSSFSGDGRLFAFRSNRDGGWAVYVAPVDKLPVAHPIKMISLESEGSTTGGHWTSTGLALHVIDNQTNLYRVDLDPQTHRPTGGPIRLTQDSPQNNHALISPDNGWVAYQSRGRASGSGIAVMTANGAREHVVKEMMPAVMNGTDILGWKSADELLLAVPEVVELRTPLFPKHLATLTISTGELRSHSGPALEVDGRIAFAPRSDTIYYSIDRNLKARSASGGPERSITKIDRWETFKISSDEKWIAYTIADYPDNKPAPGEIRLRSVETGAERVLARYADSKEGSHGVMAFSPDAKMLLYCDPLVITRIMNIATGESWPLISDATPAADFENSPNATWSSDGSFVLIEGQLRRSTWRLFEGVTYDAVKKLLTAPKK